MGSQAGDRRREQGTDTVNLTEVVSQMAPYSLYSALLLTRAHKVQAKSSALSREKSANLGRKKNSLSATWQ